MIKYSKLRDKLKVETLNGNAEDLAFFKTSNNIVIVAITSNYRNGIYQHNFVLFYYEP